MKIKEIKKKDVLQTRKDRLYRFWWRFGQIFIGILLLIAIILEYYIIFIDGKCYKDPCYYANQTKGYICYQMGIPAGMT
jgi:hypothetical protein